MSYIAVIGAGSWGTTLSAILADKGYDTSLWVFEDNLAQEIEKTRMNSIYLPGVTLPENLTVSHRIDEVVKKARYILNVVPTQYTRDVFKEVINYINKDSVIISASKGIERGSLLTCSSILKELSGRKVAVISGPSFAKEVVNKLPTAVTIATEDADIALMLQEVFNTNYFRVYTHDDIVGVEIGGALKNVIAIASGISDGLGLGYNARAALITRGLAEITRLGAAMGAREQTFSGLSGLGDLVLTCTGAMSRNYTVGYKLGQGIKLRDILSATRSVAEGVATAESAFELSKRHMIEMPITEQVYRVIYRDKAPAIAVKDLMDRSLKSEFY